MVSSCRTFLRLGSHPPASGLRKSELANALRVLDASLLSPSPSFQVGSQWSQVGVKQCACPSAYLTRLSLEPHSGHGSLRRTVSVTWIVLRVGRSAGGGLSSRHRRGNHP